MEGRGKMKKRRLKRKKLIALLSSLALLLAGGIGTGVAFAAMAAVKKDASSHALADATFQNVKTHEEAAYQARIKAKKKNIEKAKAKEDREKRSRPALLASSTSGEITTSNANVIAGGVWSGGEVNSSDADFSSSPSSSIPSSNSVSLSFFGLILAPVLLFSISIGRLFLPSPNFPGDTG